MEIIDTTEFSPKRHRNSPYRAAVGCTSPTKADIIDDIRVGLRQANSGEGRPARLPIGRCGVGR